MAKTKMVIIMIVVIVVIMAMIGYWFYQSRLVPKEEVVFEESCLGMSLIEAKEITKASECGERLKDTYMCNEDTATWWLDLDIEKEGCSPACVINVKTKQAAINWRCTGLRE